jgi:hypothetical protein
MTDRVTAAQERWMIQPGSAADREQVIDTIEASVRCQQGLVLSAYRRGFGQMENAA